MTTEWISFWEPDEEPALEPVFEKVQRTSIYCARSIVHSTELCDDYSTMRLVYFGWECECECHDA